MKNAGAFVCIITAIFIFGFVGFISCTVDGDDTATTTTVTPDGDIHGWEKVCEGAIPSCSSWRAAAYDTDRNRLVIYGGNRLSDTWEYDGTQWYEIITPTSPGPLDNASACYNPHEKKVFLFGGTRGQGNFSEELWVYDGVNWENVTPQHSPPKRCRSSMCYDAKRQCIVLFGGKSYSKKLNDTWEWKDGEWFEVYTEYSPPARNFHALVFNPAREGTILYGGILQHDTWFYDGKGWEQLPTTSDPGPRSHPGLTYDPISQTVFLFSSYISEYYLHTDLWELQGDTWSLIQDFGSTDESAFHYPFLFAIPGRSEYLLFCSRCGDFGEEADSSTLLYFVTSEGLTLAPLQTVPQPVYYGISMTMDTSESTYYLAVRKDKVYGKSLWTFDGSSWHHLTNTPDLDNYNGNYILDYDQKREVLLFFPGYKSSSSQMPFIMFEFHDNQWSHRSFDEGPRVDEGFSHAFDQDRGVLVIFGGFMAYSDYSDQTWEYDGNTWKKRSMPISPSPRAYAHMVYDYHRKKIVMFGGWSDNDVRQRDTWEFDGFSWERVNAPHAPAVTGSRYYSGPMVYHGGLEKTILYLPEGELYSVQSNFWSYDGTDWQPIHFDNEPAIRTMPAGAYNQFADVFLLFGGRSRAALYTFTDTWELKP